MLRTKHISYFLRSFNASCRRYSKKLVGDKFTSITEVEEYLSNETWSVKEYIDTNIVDQERLPSQETILKLLKLSGLPDKQNDLEGMRQRLGKQLSFIHKLHKVPVENDSIDPMDARLMPRKNTPLTYDQLISRIEKQEKNPEIGEVDNSWESTELARLKKNGYFMVRGGLMTNRD